MSWGLGRCWCWEGNCCSPWRIPIHFLTSLQDGELALLWDFTDGWKGSQTRSSGSAWLESSICVPQLCQELQDGLSNSPKAELGSSSKKIGKTCALMWGTSAGTRKRLPLFPTSLGILQSLGQCCPSDVLGLGWHHAGEGGGFHSSRKISGVSAATMNILDRKLL